MKLLLIDARQMLQNMPADLDLHVTLLGKELCLVVSVKDLGVHMDVTMCSGLMNIAQVLHLLACQV